MQIVKILVKEGADVNIYNSAGSTPLHRACRSDIDTLEKVCVNCILLEGDFNALITIFVRTLTQHCFQANNVELFKYFHNTLLNNPDCVSTSSN